MKNNCYCTLIFLFVFLGKTMAQNPSIVKDMDGYSLIFAPGPAGIPGISEYAINHLPLSNYHFSNPFYFNPAMAGIEDKKQLNTDWNRQIDHSFLASYEQPISSINSALGMYFSYSSDYLHTIRNYGLAYNYGFKIRDNAKLKLGVQFSQVNISLNETALGSLESSSKWHSVPSMDIGVAFQVDQLRLGVSIQNLFPSQVAFADGVTTFTNAFLEDEKLFNISFANTFKLSEKCHWSLAALVRSNDINDVSSYISINKRFSLGATFRTKVEHHWIGFIGVKIKEKVNLQFSFNTQKDDFEDQRFIESLVQYQF